MGFSVQPGTLLAHRYRVEFELGRGGMGAVYACQDLFVGDRAAIKLLQPTEGASPEEGTAWFWAEARALASLDHPGIVRGRDFGLLEHHMPFLVMDLAPGISLTDLVLATHVSWPTTWLIVDQVLAALSHAHARGVIHGDLKHSNIMVELLPTDVRVRLLDFGLAWLLRDRFDHRIDGTSLEGPTVRPRAGTVGWMAPEQIRGAVPHVGPATDLYALGCILYQLLCGSEPYEARELEEIQRMHRNAPIPELHLPDGVPSAVGPFVRRLLAKRPWKRYDFAAEARSVFTQFRPAGDPGSWLLPDPGLPNPAESAAKLMAPEGSAGSKTSIPLSGRAPKGVILFGPGQLVGRENEKEALRQTVKEITLAPSGSTQLMVMTGAPGVGKSRLAEWLCEEVHEQATALPLRARHNRIPTQFDGIAGAVLTHLGLANTEKPIVEQTLMNLWEVKKDDEEGLLWVAAVAEWLCPSVPGQAEDPGPTGKRYVINTDEIAWLVIEYALSRLASARPLLLWMDDLHRASRRDVGLLIRLRTQPTWLRTIVVGTTVSSLPNPEDDLAPHIKHLLEIYEGKLLRIDPLAEEDTRALLLSIGAIDDASLESASRRCNGIPLFALQLLHSWATDGSLQFVDGLLHVKEEALQAIPSTTATLWDERLAALTSEARIAALAASALGGEVRRGILLRLLLALKLQPSTTLLPLEQLQLLIKVDGERYRWPHAMLQEHLLAELMNHERSEEIFKQAAFALASYHPAAGSRRVVRHRVTNLIRANEIGDAVRVMLDFVQRAWARTRDVAATLEDLAIVEGLGRGALAAMHKRWRAEALRHAGQLDEATSLAFSARRVFGSLNDVYNEAQCMRLLGHIASEKGLPKDGRQLVAEARSMMSSIPHDWGRAQCDVVLGELDYLIGDHELAQYELERALGPLKRADDVLGTGQCLILLSFIALAQNQISKPRELLLEARKGFDQIGYRLGTAQCDVALAHADHRALDFSAARTRANKALATFELLGTPRGQSAALRVMAMAGIDAGDSEEAERHATQALEIFEVIGDPWGVVECRLLLAQVALARGDVDARIRVEACELDGVQEREPLQHWYLTHAWLAWNEKRYSDAVEHMEAAKDALGGGRLGDHAPHLFAMLCNLQWPPPLRSRVAQATPEVGQLTRSAFARRPLRPS